MKFTDMSRDAILSLAKPTEEYEDKIAQILESWPKPQIDWKNKAKAIAAVRSFGAVTDEFDEPDFAVAEQTVRVPTPDGNELPGIVFKPARSFVPDTLPLVVLYHGGGYAFGTPKQLADTARTIVKQCGAVVVSQSYRLAPEHTFPIPTEDIRDTFFWIAKNAKAVYRADANAGLIIGGVSAGANAANVVAHLARDEDFTPRITGVWFSAGSVRVPLGDEDKLESQYRDRLLSRTQQECLNEPLLSADLLKLLQDCLKPDLTSKLSAPLLWPGGHKDLPKVYFQVCGRDPGRDDAFIFQAMLEREGVQTRLDLYAGLPHCFWMALSGLAETKKWEKDTLDGFRWLLNTSSH